MLTLPSIHSLIRTRVVAEEGSSEMVSFDTPKKTAKITPQGNECYQCSDARRRFFDETLDKLVKAREGNPALEADFQAKRTARILKTGEFDDVEKITTKSFLENRNTKFEEYFETVGFIEIK